MCSISSIAWDFKRLPKLVLEFIQNCYEIKMYLTTNNWSHAGRKVLITGGTKGIGSSISQEMLFLLKD